MQNSPKNKLDFNQPTKNLGVKDNKLTTSQSRSALIDREKSDIQTMKSPILVLVLMKIAKKKVRDSINLLKDHKRNTFCLELIKSKRKRNLRLGFLKIYSCYLQRKDKTIKSFLDHNSHIRLMSAVLNIILKQRKKSSFKNIHQVFVRRKKILNFAKILQKHLSRVNLTLKKGPCFEKLKQWQIYRLRIKVKLKNILHIVLKAKKRLKRQCFLKIVSQAYQKQNLNVRKAKQQIKEKVNEKSRNRFEHLSAEKQKLRSARMNVDHHSCIKNKSKYDGKKQISSMLSKSTIQSKQNAKSAKQIQTDIEEKKNTIKILLQHCTKLRQKKKQAKGYQTKTIKLFKQIDKIRQINDGLIALPKNLLNEVNKIESVDEYHLVRGEILRKQISFYEDRLNQEEQFDHNRVENKSLKNLMMKAIQKYYEETCKEGSVY